MSLIKKKPSYLRLYEYHKVLENRKSYQILKSQNLTIQKEMKPCTFHPKTHFSNLYKNRSLTFSSLTNSLTQRNDYWENKKKNSIKKIYIAKVKKDEFSHKPNIQRDQRYFKNCKDKAIDVLSDPESYLDYIEMKKKLRQKSLDEKKLNESRPGSGLVYNGKPTVIREFKFNTSIRNTKRSKSYCEKNMPDLKKKRNNKKNKDNNNCCLDTNEKITSNDNKTLNKDRSNYSSRQKLRENYSIESKKTEAKIKNNKSCNIILLKTDVLTDRKPILNREVNTKFSRYYNSCLKNKNKNYQKNYYTKEDNKNIKNQINKTLNNNKSINNNNKYINNNRIINNILNNKNINNCKINQKNKDNNNNNNNEKHCINFFINTSNKNGKFNNKENKTNKNDQHILINNNLNAKNIYKKFIKHSKYSSNKENECNTNNDKINNKRNIKINNKLNFNNEKQLGSSTQYSTLANHNYHSILSNISNNQNIKNAKGISKDSKVESKIDKDNKVNIKENKNKDNCEMELHEEIINLNINK